jgi:hypothetical protein
MASQSNLRNRYRVGSVIFYRNERPLPRREEAGIGSAGANFKLHPFGTPGAMAHVGRAFPVGIDPGIHVATSKMHAKKRGRSPRRGSFLQGAVGTEIQIETFVLHCRILPRSPQTCTASPKLRRTSGRKKAAKFLISPANLDWASRLS